MWTKVIDGHLEIFGKILSLLKNQSTTQYHNRLVKIYLNSTIVFYRFEHRSSIIFSLDLQESNCKFTDFGSIFCSFLEYDFATFYFDEKTEIRTIFGERRQSFWKNIVKLMWENMSDCVVLSWPAFLLHVIWNICVKNTYTHFIFIESEELHACKI